MQRTVQPELLDSLPHDHPDALHNRRDLRLTNWVTGNHRWLMRMLSRFTRPGERLLELGAGTGELALQLAQAGYAIDALDLCPPPAAWPAAQRWHKADLCDFGGYTDYEVIVANLILHQFTEPALAHLGAKLRHARVIIACEPVRRRLSQHLFRVFAVLCGANHVSRHDAHVSIAAGFRGAELPRLLGLLATEWQIACEHTPLGTYRMIAVRRT